MSLFWWFQHLFGSRAEICQIFRRFFGKFKKSKRHPEIYWPLHKYGILQCLPSKILKSWSWVTIIWGTTLLFTIVGVGGTGAVLIGKLDCPIWNCGEEATPKLFMGKLRPGFVAGPLFEVSVWLRSFFFGWWRLVRLLAKNQHTVKSGLE